MQNLGLKTYFIMKLHQKFQAKKAGELSLEMNLPVQIEKYVG